MNLSELDASEFSAKGEVTPLEAVESSIGRTKVPDFASGCFQFTVRKLTQRRRARDARGLWIFWIVVLVAGCSAEPQAKPPNLVLVVIDALRADHLGSYGYPRPTTPKLDQLASEGVRFDRALSAASWTLPSLMSLFTSRYPPNLPNNFDSVPRGYSMDSEERTLAEALRDAGYRTLSATTNPFNIDPIFQLMQGFEERRYELSAPASWVVDQALDLIADEPEPFFLYLHLMDTHTPYDPPAPFDSMFLENGREADSTHRNPAGVSSPSELQSPDFQRRREQTLALYDGALRFADEELGRLLAGLEALGIRETTVVAVTSDHGESFWDRVPLEFDLGLHAYQTPNRYGVGHGHSVFSELVHVPLILQGPGVPVGVSTWPASGLDLAPTLLGLAGVHVGTLDAQGVDLLEDPSRRAAFSETTQAAGHTMRSLVGERHQLVRLDASGGERLFDHRQAGWPETESPKDLEKMSRELDDRLEAGRRVGVQNEPLDEETVERLRALGYTE